MDAHEEMNAGTAPNAADPSPGLGAPTDRPDGPAEVPCPTCGKPMTPGGWHDEHGTDGPTDGTDGPTDGTDGPTEDEVSETLSGAWRAMLFTCGHYSDNPNAPSTYGPDAPVPDPETSLRPEQFTELRSDVLGFLRSPGVLDAIRATTAEDWRGGRAGFERAGEVFHYVRNGHGISFRDGDWTEPEPRVRGGNCRTRKVTAERLNREFRPCNDGTCVVCADIPAGPPARDFGPVLDGAARCWHGAELETEPTDPERSDDGPLYRDESGKLEIRFG